MTNLGAAMFQTRVNRRCKGWQKTPVEETLGTSQQRKVEPSVIQIFGRRRQYKSRNNNAQLLETAVTKIRISKHRLVEETYLS